MDGQITFPPRFSLRSEEPVDGLAIVAVGGELDMVHSAEVRDSLRAAVLRAGAGMVILDLTRLEFIDSTGLVAIVDAARILRVAERAPLVVAGGGHQVRRLLELTRVANLVQLVESAGEALAIAAPVPKAAA